MTARRAGTVLLLGLVFAVGPASSAAATPGPGASGAVVLIGVPGLRWDDISPTATPALWHLAGGGAVGSLSVRTIDTTTCPADGWLTLGAGARATLGPGPDRGCPEIPRPSGSAPAALSDWAGIEAANAGTAYDPQLGLLADSVATAGGCGTAVGPGAALALADRTGTVHGYVPDASRIDSTLLRRCPLTVVAAEAVQDTARGPAVLAADRLVARVATALPARATLVVAGLADSGPVPHLHALLARGPAFGPGLLAAASTRQAGLAQLTDLAPALLTTLGADVPPASVGSPLTVIASTSPSRQRVAGLAALDEAAQVQRASTGWFFVLSGGGALAVLGAVLLLLRRGRPSPARRARLLRTGRALFIGFAALPAGAWLAGALPWWRSPAPGPVLWLAVAGIAVVVAAAALLGPWARHPLGAPGAVAALTALVLGTDVTVLGSSLAVVSPLGLSPLTGGRFYGFGNIGFAVFATTALLAASWAASVLLRAGRSHRSAALVVAVIGTVAVLVDGWPGYGSDFGGMLALTPAFVLLTLRVAGTRLTATRALLIGLGTVALVSVVAGLDWARPAAERSHLGQFVQKVIDGQAGALLLRKLGAAAASLTTGRVAWLVPLVLLALAVVALQPRRWGARGLDDAYAAEPALRDGVVASLLAATLGMVLNDAGVQLPGVCLVVGGALVAAAACRPAQPAPPPPPRQVRAPAPGLPAASG